MTDRDARSRYMQAHYRTIRAIEGPLLFVRRLRGVAAGELVRVVTGSEERRGHVLEVQGDTAVVQVFEGTNGLNLDATTVAPLGEPIHLGVSQALLGRRLDGQGRPIDGKPLPPPEARRDINGNPLNVTMRKAPSDFVETGVSSIDGLNSLVRGQKLPIFSVAGAPALELALDITLAARAPGNIAFAVVFAGIGLTSRELAYVERRIGDSAAAHRITLFLNRSDDPATERLMTPRLALTLAEHFAFAHAMHVLVILVDMSNYCEALREVSAAREEIPGRRGYPGYMYTDLASLYERTGQVLDSPGSITQLPILTMPDDDITHPIADLTGYVTEGQIVLSRELWRRGVSPPIDVLPSLSRLMDRGIGEGRTLFGHREIADQLYAAYARGVELRELGSILGEGALLEEDLPFVRFASDFEQEFVRQDGARRGIAETMRLGWRLLRRLPPRELTRLRPETLARLAQEFGDGKTEP